MKSCLTLSAGLTVLAASAAAVRTPLSAGILEKRQCLPPLNYTAEISYKGCYVDKDDKRTLRGHSSALSNNSPQNCANICGRAGFAYAGVEYGRECFCGDNISNESAPEEECNTVCPGDPSEKCGQSYRVNIWNVDNALDEGESFKFPNCNREPLCSNAVCDASLSFKERAKGLVSLWTVEEKLNNLVDKAAGVPRLGIKPYDWWAEGLHGLANQGVNFEAHGSGEWDVATSFPQPILTAAAFDDELVTSIGDVISTETRAFNADGRVGFNLYTPNINNFKDPRWGRGQETPGEDPFHAVSYTRAMLSGLEAKVNGYKKTIVTCKHYAGNDFDAYGSVSRHNFDAQITSQDLNEFYLAPFRACAERDGGGVMCSYNAVNGHPACASKYLLQDVLRTHWGWDKDEHWVSTDCGVMSDTWSKHKYVDTPGEAAKVLLEAGTDLNCEFGRTEAWFEAWNKSLIAEPQIDKALVRLWSSLVSVGMFDPAEGQSLRQLTFDAVNTEAAQKLAYDAAIAGSVLIKNDDSHLPLASGNKAKKVTLIGPWVNATEQMQGNYYGPAPYLISPRQAAEDRGLDFTWAKGVAINAADPSSEKALEQAAAAEEIIFMGGIDNTIEAESRDRTSISWPTPQLELLRKLSDLGKPITIVQFGGGQLDSTELLENEAIRAILWSGYPGQSGGKAVLDLVYGDAAPAGRLPVTQYPNSYLALVPPTDMTLRPGQNGTNPGRTHMWYTGDAPVPFGHGLHYTKFQVTLEQGVKWQGEFRRTKGAISRVGELVASKNWMEVINLPAATVPVKVKNVGRAKSDYVVLLFLRTTAGPQPRPKKTLVGYTRVKGLKPGSSKTVDVTLQLERFLRVDESGNQVIYPGNYELFVDIDSKDSVELKWTGRATVVEEFPQQE